MINNQIINRYQNKIEEIEAQSLGLKKEVTKYSMIRLFIFLLSLPTFYFLSKTTILYFLLTFLGIAIIFIWAVLLQQKYQKLYNQSLIAKTINENEITTLSAHNNMYYNGAKHADGKHLFSDDLDIFGSHSIYALINRCNSYYGNEWLKKILLDLPSVEKLLERRKAIQELENDQHFAQELYKKLYSDKSQHGLKVHELIQHPLDMDLSFAGGKMLKRYIKALPFIWLGIFAMFFIHNDFALNLSWGVFIINVILIFRKVKEVNKVQSHLSRAGNNLTGYIESIQHAFSKNWESNYLQEAQAQLQTAAGKMPVKMLADFKNILDLLDYRLNLLVAILLNGMLLWDLKIVNRLSDWKKEHYSNLFVLFDHLGQLEAICSLSTWSYNHPNYLYPEIHDDYLTLHGKDLNHPLILKNSVSNSFDINPNHKVSIITGSNMSGKSTFLRTLGINMVLSYAGSKAFATHFSLPIVQLATYMRIKDALEESVSTFKAELNRVELILNLISKKGKTLVLIDEMLRGTNSKDKLKGSMSITQKLKESHAYSIIATHDIKLAEMGEQDPQITNYYFDIDYEEGELVFDYKIKQGICENFNASFLLSQLGLEMD